MDIISSLYISSFLVNFLPSVGASAISFDNPFFARATVISSKIAPIAIINATSPAAKISPIDIDAIIAIEISKAEDTHL